MAEKSENSDQYEKTRGPIIDALLDGPYDDDLYSRLTPEDQDYVDDVFYEPRERTAGHVIAGTRKRTAGRVRALVDELDGEDTGVKVKPLPGMDDPTDVPEAGIDPEGHPTSVDEGTPGHGASPEKEADTVTPAATPGTLGKIKGLLDNSTSFSGKASARIVNDVLGRKQKSWNAMTNDEKLIYGVTRPIATPLWAVTRPIAWPFQGAAWAMSPSSNLYTDIAKLLAMSSAYGVVKGQSWNALKTMGNLALELKKTIHNGELPEGKRWTGPSTIAKTREYRAEKAWKYMTTKAEPAKTKAATGPWYKRGFTHLTNGTKKVWSAARMVSKPVAGALAYVGVNASSVLIEGPSRAILGEDAPSESTKTTGWNIDKNKGGLRGMTDRLKDGVVGIKENILDVFSIDVTAENVLALGQLFKDGKVIETYKQIIEEEESGDHAPRSVIGRIMELEKRMPASKYIPLLDKMHSVLMSKATTLKGASILHASFSGDDDAEKIAVDYGQGFFEKLSKQDVNNFKKMLKGFDLGDLINKSGIIFKVTDGDFTTRILDHGANRNMYAQGLNAIFGFAQNASMPRTAFTARLAEIYVHINEVKAGDDPDLARRAQVFEDALSVINITLEENNFNRLFVTSAHGNSSASAAA